MNRESAASWRSEEVAEAVAEERRTAGRGDVARSVGRYLCCWDGGRPARKSCEPGRLLPHDCDWHCHLQMATHSVDHLRPET